MSDPIRIATNDLIVAGNNLAFAAQTTGGTAGRDEGLVMAVEAWSVAREKLVQVRRIVALEGSGAFVSAGRENWWEWGVYDGTSCAHCGRERVMTADAPDGAVRRVCEKCGWDQELGDYATTYTPSTPDTLGDGER